MKQYKTKFVMAQDSKIEWTHHTANLWWGCKEVHEGCDNCYARVLANRWGFEVWGNDSGRRIIESVWKDLARYQKLAAAAGEIHRVFVGSMMDIFEKPMPLINSKGGAVIMSDGSWASTENLRQHFFHHIIPDCPNLLFLLLTKRPSNINKYIPDAWKTNPPVNVMFGTSPVNQVTANKLIPQLFSVKGKRFLSVEPQLGPIDLTNIIHKICSDDDHLQPLFGNTEILDILNGERIHGQIGYSMHKIDWVIQGGESGPGKRPFDLQWAYNIRDQCTKAGIPYFMKQIDKIQPIPDNLKIRQFPVNG